LEETTKELQPYTLMDAWQHEIQTPPLTREILMQSLEAARAYYLNQQKTDGNFKYLLDLSDGKTSDDDNQVRQAGAIWGLSCLNRDFFNEPTRRALLLGFDFFIRNIKTLPTGETVIVYPGEKNLNSGTVALFCLALTDFLAGQDKYLDQNTKDKYRRILFTHLQFLRTMELDDGSWSRAYELSSGIRKPVPSSYYDGEALLAYCKAARLYNRKDLIRRINFALPRLIHRYTVQTWQPDGDQDLTKGFYQWGSMAFAEYVEAGWEPHAKLAADAAMALAWWQIDENQLEAKKANVAYAVEGLAATWRIARMTKREAEEKRLKSVIDNIMGKLILCQYKGPFMQYNPYLMSLKNVVPEAYGGITAAQNSPFVRIDNVQHQVHATLLMLEYLYPETK
jgi:UDP-N-acetylmuramoyl-tripeptide--D-alanyl-D-alanine ligase